MDASEADFFTMKPAVKTNKHRLRLSGVADCFQAGSQPADSEAGSAGLGPQRPERPAGSEQSPALGPPPGPLSVSNSLTASSCQRRFSGKVFSFSLKKFNVYCIFFSLPFSPLGKVLFPCKCYSTFLGVQIGYNGQFILSGLKYTTVIKTEFLNCFEDKI